MKTKLSNSSVDKYLQCSFCYYLHYILSIRPVKRSSALVFGGIIDDSFNILLIDKDLQKALNFFDDDISRETDDLKDLIIETFKY